MKYLFKILLILLLPCVATAQLTLRVTAIPANTPEGAKIYVAGNFNNWNAAEAASIMARQSDGTYQLTISPAVGTVEFKLTRGSWPTVEGNANGAFRPNRTVAYDGTARTVDLSVLTWEDLGGSNPTGGTAAANVFLLDDDFALPQLNRKRRVWIYLPPDYQTAPDKRYPVLYMHDAQNLFDARLSFSGEWQVDESLNDLFKKGDYGCIVVGIDNGGSNRLNEYSPWVNARYGGGEGDEYAEFLVKTLKPYVDGNYRTLVGRQSTGIMGSSMGGLISMYAFSEYQDVFSRAGVFSPAFWFGADAPAQHVRANPKEGAGRVYFLAGGAEPAYVADDARKVAAALQAAGFSTSEILTKVPADGQHSEWFWAREFPEAYRWLFADAVTLKTKEPERPQLRISPNPARDEVRISGFPAGTSLQVKLIGVEGKIWRDTTLRSGESLRVADLPTGFYWLQARPNNGIWQSAKVVLKR
jgi:predicted alpha/beta superfamily hydrolase